MEVTQTTMVVDESSKILSTPCHTNKTKSGLARPFGPVVYPGYTLDITEAPVDSKFGLDSSLICRFDDYGPVTLQVMSMENGFGRSERWA